MLDTQKGWKCEYLFDVNQNDQKQQFWPVMMLDVKKVVQGGSKVIMVSALVDCP
jgi:hypothetical protein